MYINLYLVVSEAATQQTQKPLRRTSLVCPVFPQRVRARAVDTLAGLPKEFQTVSVAKIALAEAWEEAAAHSGITVCPAP